MDLCAAQIEFVHLCAAQIGFVRRTNRICAPHKSAHHEYLQTHGHVGYPSRGYPEPIFWPWGTLPVGTRSPEARRKGQMAPAVVQKFARAKSRPRAWSAGAPVRYGHGPHGPRHATLFVTEETICAMTDGGRKRRKVNEHVRGVLSGASNSGLRTDLRMTDGGRKT